MANSDQLKKIAKAVAKALQTPAGQQVLKEVVSVTGEYLRKAIQQKHTPPAGRAGHPHLVKALDANTQREWETHLTNALNSYRQHTLTAQVSYDVFYAHFWAGVTCVKYGDMTAARRHLDQAYRIGAAMLNNESSAPKYQDDPEWDRRMAVAHILDEIAPIL